MAYPESLTPNQQAALLAFMPLLRSNLINFAKLVNNFRALNNLWNNGGISAINGALTGTDIIPDLTGIAGAQTLSAADVQTAITAIQAFLVSYDTAAYESYFVRAVGPSNASSV